MSSAGTLFVISAPSGAGKTTLVKLLLERDAGVYISISYTTRPPRPGERDGREYNFIDVATFTAMRDRGDFLEWAEVHGNYYGTSKVWLDKQIQAGRDVLLEIDWQGAQQVRELFPYAVTVFVLPPTVAELEKRLRRRGEDTEEVICQRVAAANGEMRHVGEFEFVIINNDLQVALADFAAIVRAARLRAVCQRAREPEIFESIEKTAHKG